MEEKDFISSQTLEKLESIRKGTIDSSIDFSELTLNELLLQDDIGTTYLEHMIRNGITINTKLMNEIATSVQAIKVCLKCNYDKWIDSVDEDILYNKIQGDETAMDVLFEEGRSLLFKKFTMNLKIIDYIIKYDKGYYFISNEIIQKLFTKDGTYPIDKYIYNNDLMKSIISKVDIELLIKYCEDKKDYNLLKYVSEESLLYKMKDGRNVCEFLLDNNIDPLFFNYDFSSKEMIDCLLKKGRIDLLTNAKLSILFSNFDENRTYFDLMIEEYKKGKDIDFNKFSIRSYGSKDTADFLLKMAQNDVIGFFKITPGLLRRKSYGEKSVIEYLLEKDRDLTLSKIVNKNCLEDFDFVLELNKLGVDDYTPRMTAQGEQFSDTIAASYNENYAKGCVSVYEDLLMELQTLFYTDGKSDKKIIDLLITSYRYQTTSENEFALMEIKQMIEIKKHYPDKFTYINDGTGSYFQKREGGVHLDIPTIGTLNHETSHALHYYLAGDYVPDNYSEVIERARKDPKTTVMLKEYATRLHQIRNEVLASVSKSKISEYYDTRYAGKEGEKLKEFLQLSKEEKKKQFGEDYPEEALDIILEETFTFEEFIKQRKEIEEKEVLFIILRNEYDAYFAVLDIADAAFLGKSFNGVVRDEEGKYLPDTPGHGIDYYSLPNHGFDEMIANYGQIMKSKEASKYIEILRQIVGNEVVDMIEEVYKNKILYSTVFIKNINSEEEEKSHGR